MHKNLTEALPHWTRLLGSAGVLDAQAAQRKYGFDTSGATRRIPLALRPTDAGQVLEIIRIAHQYGAPVYPISTGNNWGYGTSLPVTDDCTILDLSGLNRILHFDAELGVVTVEPGVTQQQLSDFLDAGEHDFLVPVTGAGPSCSLLSNALERGYGITPNTDHFAAVTDLKAVLGDGSLYETTLARAGAPEAARLFKWGVGAYIPGLFSQGNLGVVTQMTLTLARRPACIRIGLFGLPDEELLAPAVARIRQILNRLPGIVGGINLMNRHRMLAMTVPYPAERLNARGLIPPQVVEQLGRDGQIQPWTGLVTLYGTPAVVAAAQAEIREAMRGLAKRLMFFSRAKAERLARIAAWIPGPHGRQLKRTVQTLARSMELFDGKPNETALPLAYWRNPKAQPEVGRNPARDRCGLIWYAPLVPMRATDVRTYVDMVRRVTLEHAIEPLITLTSVNERVFDSTVPILFDANNASRKDQARACKRALLEAGRALGYLPYRYGVDDMDWLLSLHPDLGRPLPLSALQSRILAPGRYARPLD